MARADRIATATLAAQGAKDTSGQPVLITDPQEVARDFVTRLHSPLDAERTRAAYLKEVAKA